MKLTPLLKPYLSHQSHISKPTTQDQSRREGPTKKNKETLIKRFFEKSTKKKASSKLTGIPIRY
jgi:hypothetical protein